MVAWREGWLLRSDGDDLAMVVVMEDDGRK